MSFNIVLFFDSVLSSFIDCFSLSSSLNAGEFALTLSSNFVIPMGSFAAYLSDKELWAGGLGTQRRSRTLTVGRVVPLARTSCMPEKIDAIGIMCAYGSSS
jgi:hypothetical protein